MSGIVLMLLGGSGGSGGGGGTGLSASILAGQGSKSTGPTYTFPTNTCTATNGTAPYTYLWSETSDSNGVWTTGGTASTFTPQVSGVLGGNVSIAYYICTVTDATGKVVASNTATYSHLNNSGGL